MLFGQFGTPLLARRPVDLSAFDTATLRIFTNILPLRGTQAAVYTDVYLQPPCGMRNGVRVVCVPYLYTPSPYQGTELSTYNIWTAGAPILPRVWRGRAAWPSTIPTCRPGELNSVSWVSEAEKSVPANIPSASRCTHVKRFRLHPDDMRNMGEKLINWVAAYG